MDIAAVHYENGSITSVKLDNGISMSIGSAIALCKEGKLPAYHVGSTRNDSNSVHETLVSNRGDHVNLSDMPRF